MKWCGIFLLFFCVVVSGFSGAVTSQSIQVSTQSSFVLLTGFEPFDAYEVNPSQEIVEALHGTCIANCSIVGLVLPVSFNTSVDVFIDAVEQYHPVVILSFGLSPRAKGFEVEQCAINLKKTSLNGSFSFPKRIDCDGPFFRVSSLSAWSNVQLLRFNQVPARVSFFAGMYVCNFVYYSMLGYLSDSSSPVAYGFMHVPFLLSQDPEGLPLECMVFGVVSILESLLAS